METYDRTALLALADALEYPSQGAAPLRRAAVLLGPDHLAAARRLAALADRFDSEGAGAVEEAYVAAFELSPIASPFVGDQLFGASQARHLFLLRVQGLQRAAGFDAAPELPDHLSAVLRFLAVGPPGEEHDALARDAALPAARKMLGALDAVQHPWAGALAAVVEVLAATAGAEDLAAAAVVAPAPSVEATP
jgi:nitrate reductase assembly molybdenum cofactor insertion protein NarJ